MERPVTFVKPGGCRLFGMLYSPDPSVSRNTGIVISVNAIKYRVGTFGLHVRLARLLALSGYTVLTFDPEGIGDSEGVFEYKTLTEHYFDIQTGKYNADLRCAMDFMNAEPGIERLALLGLCGGAVSVLMAGADDPRVTGMILLNLPVLVEDLAKQGREDNAGKITSVEAASTLLKGKLARLGEPAFWGRLMRMQVDLREEWSLVRRGVYVLFRKLLPIWSGKRAKDEAALVAPISPHRLFNMHFQKAYLAAASSGKRMLFLFAEHDPWTWIFKSEFQDPAMQPGHRHESLCEVKVMPGANHIFSAADSQAALTQDVLTWLGRLT